MFAQCCRHGKDLRQLSTIVFEPFQHCLERVTRPEMIIYRLLGGVFLVIGAIGLVLPIWPTTIFWILAALCFARSSPAARDWIYARPGIGPVVEEFVEYGRLSRKSKTAATVGMMIALAICIISLRSRISYLLVAAGLIGIGLVFVWTRPLALSNEDLSNSSQ